jgi:hypothetical protein
VDVLGKRGRAPVRAPPGESFINTVSSIPFYTGTVR